MRRLFVVLFAVLLMVGGGEDIFAKSRGGGSRKSSFKLSKPKPRPKPAPTKKIVKPKKTRTDKKSTIKKTSTSTKPKAVSSNKMDRKQTKAMKTKNTAAGKKYGNKANASKAYKGDMAKKHTSYRSSTPPATRPASVPRTVVVVAGQPGYAVGYHPFGGGFYGYGYMDPVTNMYVRLAAAQMIANDMALQNAGYGHYGANGAPVVYRSNGLIIFLSIFGFICLIVIVVAVVKRN
jgi:hypothetical protein